MTKPLFRLLSHVELAPSPGRSQLPVGQVAQFLAYLAYEGDWRGRDVLAFLFRPDQRESVARRNLRTLLRRARQDAEGI